MVTPAFLAVSKAWRVISPTSYTEPDAVPKLILMESAPNLTASSTALV